MSTDSQHRPHPQAVVFPPHSDGKYDELKQSIRIHGQQQAIEVQKGTGFLLDGRHRLRACADLRTEPTVREVDVADADVPIYTGAKAAQRDLTTTQRALLALALLPAFKARAAHRKGDGVRVCEGEKGRRPRSPQRSLASARAPSIGP